MYRRKKFPFKFFENIDERPDRAAIELVEAALRADAPDISALTSRRSYPNAARLLVAECRPSYAGDVLIPALGLRTPATAYRLAVVFGLAETHLNGAAPDYGINVLRAQAPNSEDARVGLACLAALVTPWGEASRRERAGFLLGKLVRQHWRGEP